MMIAIPLAALGIEDFHDIDVEFKIADSDTVYDEMEDFYCDGDAAPLGRLNYVYRNYTTDYDRDDVTDLPEAETAAETQTTVESESESKQEAAGGGDGGCASVVSVMPGVLPLAIVAAFALRKKKD